MRESSLCVVRAHARSSFSILHLHYIRLQFFLQLRANKSKLQSFQAGRGEGEGAGAVGARPVFVAAFCICPVVVTFLGGSCGTT
eukprot:COSAG06_NODE_3326_length_5501_cov_63.180118_3_plen_84_part_00